jgi:hypothetical protein
MHVDPFTFASASYQAATRLPFKSGAAWHGFPRKRRLARLAFWTYQAAGLATGLAIAAEKPLETALGALAVLVAVLVPLFIGRRLWRFYKARRAIHRRVNA